MDIKTWGLTETGTTFHSFSSDGVALCRKNIKVRLSGADRTEAQVRENIQRSLGALGYSMCASCAKKETAYAARLEASMQPSTGEGDHLPPSAPERIGDACKALADMMKMVAEVRLSYPAANGFTAIREGRGPLVGYTFDAGFPGDARFGWVSTDGRVSRNLFYYRSQAERSSLRDADSRR